MESPGSSLIERWFMEATVSKIEQKFETVNWRKNEQGQSEHDRVSLGWFVQFEGSMESICFGSERPAIQPGDKFKISFEKERKENAKS